MIQMKYWLTAEPIGNTSEPLWMIYSEDAIIAEYYETWQRQARAYNKAHGYDANKDISRNNCIQDWIVIHWATPATPESLFKIIQASNDE